MDALSKLSIFCTVKYIIIIILYSVGDRLSGLTETYK